MNDASSFTSVILMDTTLPGHAARERLRNIHRFDRLRDAHVLRFGDDRIRSRRWPPENIWG